MLIFAREWVTWIDQLVVNNSIIRCCISLILVLCTTMPNMFQQPQEQASKQPTNTHLCGEDITDMFDVQCPRQLGSEPCSTQT
jgi:hypothetical protein